jgi:tetraacyldisaccharide 4'-kinase
MIRFFRLLLFPFSLVYGLGVMARNALYQAGILKSYVSPVKTIAVGNLAVGGTGKTPATEYLCRMLMGQLKIAVLSRGYGRKSSGFRWVNTGDAAAESGDEPLQLKRKLPALTVAVCESRVAGIVRLEEDHDLVILDDAFQHRAILPGLNILLFDYSSLKKPQFLLPAGNLREPFASRRRAGVLLVTKSPVNLSGTQREAAIARLQPYPGQEVLFAYLQYGELIALNGGDERSLKYIEGKELILLTGIANPLPLLGELEKYTSAITHYRFGDHHTFTRENIAKLARSAAGKIIITTEKDAQRLRAADLRESLEGLAVYYLEVSMRVHAGDEARFNRIIRDYVDPEHL